MFSTAIMMMPLVVGTAFADPEAATLEAGETTYQQFCVACHQTDGSGMNGMLAVNFGKSDRLDKTDEELIASVKDGVRGSIGVMPGWKSSLSDAQITSVVAYIRATFGEQAQ